MNTITFLDFFSGIGGFRLGFEQSGMKCIGHCEIDQYADASYRAMHNVNEKEWFRSDIKKINTDELPKSELWAGGFPCQDISVSGSQHGIYGERSALFFEIIRLLHGVAEEYKPNWVVLENVKNLLSINRGRDFTTVIYSLSSCGYNIEYGLLNSRFFGVPQSRERVYIVAYRHFRADEKRKVFPVEATDGKALKRLVDGSQSSKVYASSGISRTLTAGGRGSGSSTGLYFIDLCNHAANDKFSDSTEQNTEYGNSCMNPLCERFGKRGICHIVQNKGLFQCGRIRSLTPKECFKLQGFPDEMIDKAAALHSDTQLYRQAGNSVTVPVVYAIGRRIVEIQNELDRETEGLICRMK